MPLGRTYNQQQENPGLQDIELNSINTTAMPLEGTSNQQQEFSEYVSFPQSHSLDAPLLLRVTVWAAKLVESFKTRKHPNM